MPPSSVRVREDLVNAAVLQLRQGMLEDYSALDQGDKQSELDRGDDAFSMMMIFMNLKKIMGLNMSQDFSELHLQCQLTAVLDTILVQHPIKAIRQHLIPMIHNIYSLAQHLHQLDRIVQVEAWR
jgi:hypothetical protein